MNQITDFSSLESINNLESHSEEIISSTNDNRNSDEFCDRLGLFFKSKSMDIIKSENMLNETKIYECYNELDKKSINKSNDGNENNFYNVSSINQNDFIDVMNKKCNFNDFISISKDKSEDMNLIMNQNKNENSNEEKQINFLLGKKRKLFNINYSKEFCIFTEGEFNEYITKILYEILQKNNQKTIKNKIFKIINKHKKSKFSRKEKEKDIKRKDKSDNIRKKIKSRFFKSLKNEINKSLKKAGAKYLFKFLPQASISNISREKNRNMLKLSLKEIFSMNFDKKCNIINSKSEQQNHNQFVIKYLDDNQDISEKSNYNNFCNMKYCEIYYEYLSSNEFQKDINNLKKEKETDKYIKNYIENAINLIDYFKE